ncbi:MAG: ABC transporter ATP-binding protein [Lautropia sp.]
MTPAAQDGAFAPAAKEPASDDAIVVRSLTHGFGPDGSTRVLDNVSLTVAPGEFVSLVGPSGCGKTTLLNMMEGLIAPAAGFIRVLGQPPRCGRPDLAYMLARDALLPWRTVLENAALGSEVRGIRADVRRARARALLAEVGLDRFLNHYPKALSQGMRQRTALARTFALDSKVLLMDEPFAALDAHTKLQLEDTLLALWQRERRTVVFVTHDLHEAVMVSDRVVVMCARPGRIHGEVKIDLPRPRAVGALQTSQAYHALYSRVWQMLEDGTRAGRSETLGAMN